jgi:UDP-glucose 4-epimerase
MKVLITGSSGDIGRVFTRYLIKKKIFVAGLDIREADENYADEYFRFYKCCITDKEKLKYVFTNEKPTHVVHLACSFNKVRSRKREYDIDVIGSGNVLESANMTASVRQLIFSSSASAYGGNADNQLWLNEGDPLRPGQHRYGVNKTTVEKLFTEAQLRDDLKLIMVRICIVVGPSFNKEHNIVSIINESVLMPSFCKRNKIQFIHEEDLTELLYLLLNDENASGIFNLTNETYSEIAELRNGKKYVPVPVTLVKSILWAMWNLRMLNLDPAGIDHSIYPIVLDSSKLTSRYGYKFKYSTSGAFHAALRNKQLT